MDAEKARYASWEELREYCRCVAGAVGLACTAVYGPSDPAAAEPRAEALGLALQQINIMRDVAEDWRLGRVYLPQDELARFGVTEAEIAAGRVEPVLAGPDGAPGGAGRGAHARRARSPSPPRSPQRALRARVCRASTAGCWCRCGAGATTSSRSGRSSRRSGSCGRSPRCEGGRGRRRPRRSRRGARPRRGGRTRSPSWRPVPRSVAPSRRCRRGKAIPTRRRTTASTSPSVAARSTWASWRGSDRPGRCGGSRSRCP